MPNDLSALFFFFCGKWWWRGGRSTVFVEARTIRETSSIRPVTNSVLLARRSRNVYIYIYRHTYYVTNIIEITLLRTDICTEYTDVSKRKSVSSGVFTVQKPNPPQSWPSITRTSYAHEANAFEIECETRPTWLARRNVRATHWQHVLRTRPDRTTSVELALQRYSGEGSK